MKNYEHDPILYDVQMAWEQFSKALKVNSRTFLRRDSINMIFITEIR